jgi:general secretion pathway protein M
MKFEWRQGLNFYQRLSSRERLLVGVAGGAVILISLYSFVWDPLVQAGEGVRKRIAQKQRELDQIQTMREHYLELVRQFEASQGVLAKVQPNFSLFSHIESTVSQVVTRERIASMNPATKVIGDTYREESVEFKLTGVSLEQLVDMTYRIEKGDHALRVTRLQVKKKQNDPHSFDVTATVSMLQAMEKS